MKKIILASTSPRRHELAKEMGLEFEIVPSNYEEDMSLKLSVKNLALTLSLGKAKEVASRVKEGIVIGVDTFVVFAGKRLGKPKTEANACRMLKDFSGKWVEVISGIAIIDAKSKKTVQDYEVTRVKFKKMTDDEIRRYVATGEPLDKAGAFAIQGLCAIFIERIVGCHTNVIGFPCHNIYKNLAKFGVNIFDYEKWKLL